MIFCECNSLSFSLLPRAAFLSNEIQDVDVLCFFELFLRQTEQQAGICED